MRRIGIICAAIVFLVALVSCSNKQPDVPVITTEQTTTEATTPEETTPEETTPEETTPEVTEPDFSNNPDPDGTKRY